VPWCSVQSKRNKELGSMTEKESADDQAKKRSEDTLKPFEDDVNPATHEKGGPKGPEPTRYGDWERKGRVFDF